MTCHGDCACKPRRVEGHDASTHRSVAHMVRLAVSRAPAASCTLELRVLPETLSGEHKVGGGGALVEADPGLKYMLEVPPGIGLMPIGQ